MSTPEARDRESRDSDETKFDERRREERAERKRLAERTSEPLVPADERDEGRQSR
jgi:hypothetical protein